MKTLRAVSIITGLLLCSGVFAEEPDQQQKMDSRESIKIARRYLKQCKADERTVSIGHLGWDLVREYWAKVPRLQKLRDDFEKAEEELKETMLEDEAYHSLFMRMEGPDRAEAIKEYNSKKGEIFRRLQRSSSAYRRARKKRDEALFESNIETFEYIIDDYEEKGWVIPTKWMTSSCSHQH